MRGHERGFSMVELVVVAGLAAVVGGFAAPAIATAMREYAINSDVQTVTAAVRNARFRAVSTNREYRVRFNCPGPGQMRVIEYVAAIDGQADRCDPVAFPMGPDPDQVPATVPNGDGPVLRLSQSTTFGTVATIQVTRDGRMRTVGAGAATIVLADAYQQKRVSVGLSGAVTVSQERYAHEAQ
jgi:type II secretory pathway pseudopilin PulG